MAGLWWTRLTKQSWAAGLRTHPYMYHGWGMGRDRAWTVVLCQCPLVKEQSPINNKTADKVGKGLGNFLLTATPNRSMTHVVQRLQSPRRGHGEMTKRMPPARGFLHYSWVRVPPGCACKWHSVCIWAFGGMVIPVEGTQVFGLYFCCVHKFLLLMGTFWGWNSLEGWLPPAMSHNCPIFTLVQDYATVLWMGVCHCAGGWEWKGSPGVLHL